MAQKTRVSSDLMGGDVDEGYGKVADAFRLNLSSGAEVGAAVAVYREGRKVVDLWGGYRNGITRTPWTQDTLVNVYSTTKGIAALTVALAVSRGLLSYDARVADYWPEFAQGGKDAITVRQLLAHQAGLPVIKPLLTLGDIADPAKLSERLAAQVPAWPPGTRHGYHGVTLGWYASELIRHADPKGRTLGRYFADEIAGPLGLDFHIGLPDSVDRDRVAYLHVPSQIATILHLHVLPPRLSAAWFIPTTLTAQAGVAFEGANGLSTFNREDVRVVEIPAANGTGTAESVARLYGDAATGGSEIGLTPEVVTALTAPPVTPTKGLRDKVIHIDTSYSLGFGRPIPKSRKYVIGSSDKAFGAPGAGGSVGFADPDTGVGFGYVMNKLGLPPDQRSARTSSAPGAVSRCPRDEAPEVRPINTEGDVDEGYGKVADAFRRNFSSGKEIGAAVAVYRDGRKVVDLWGGYRNVSTQAPWQKDTIVNVFSTTKGVASLAVAVAASRGLIDYDAAVADYWPEFAQAGKASITVRQLLSHQAGLVAIKPPLTLADIADPEKLSAKIAGQAPAWAPGTRHGYHAVTLGWYQSELVRHVDPKGRTLGRFFAEEIAGPLDLDFYIGLPLSVDRTRVAHLEPMSRREMLLHLHTMPPLFVAGLFNSRSLSGRALQIAAGVKEAGDFNRDEIRKLEMPAGNGTATARSIAKLYGNAATGSSELGLSQTVRDALEGPAVPPTMGLRDKVIHIDTSYSLGFGKPTSKFVFGSTDRAFGWPGAGGSFGFADPDTGIGFGYVMNRMGYHIFSDPRELNLRQALFRDVLGARTQI